ncbi:MAG: HEAT repeat domain-containing protein, partial [Candidatus Omnitrophica bacterium]|nr:HEAT repeat domain-containing protein [Candidatus Omnitrophota bacterium]
LGALKAAKATRALIEAGDDPRTEVVAAVLEAMVNIGGTQIKNKLRELTHHQDRAISLRALRALRALSQTKDTDRDNFILLINMAWNDEGKGSDEVIARLKSQSTQEMEFLDIVVLKTYSGDGMDAQKALNLLCRLGDKEIITGFLSRFSKADNKEKQKIITAFDQTRNELVIEVMISIIEGRGIKIKGDELDILRSFIITIAQKVELKEAVPALISILNKENWVSRNYIIQTLGIIGDKKSIKPVLAYLDDPDSRWTVIDALGQIKDKTVVTRLIETMDKASSDVIIAALRAIGRIGDASVIDKIREYRYDDNTNIRLTALEAINDLEILEIPYTQER